MSPSDLGNLQCQRSVLEMSWMWFRSRSNLAYPMCRWAAEASKSRRSKRVAASGTLIFLKDFAIWPQQAHHNYMQYYDMNIMNACSAEANSKGFLSGHSAVKKAMIVSFSKDCSNVSREMTPWEFASCQVEVTDGHWSHWRSCFFRQEKSKKNTSAMTAMRHNMSIYVKICHKRFLDISDMKRLKWGPGNGFKKSLLRWECKWQWRPVAHVGRSTDSHWLINIFQPWAIPTCPNLRIAGLHRFQILFFVFDFLLHHDIPVCSARPQMTTWLRCTKTIGMWNLWGHSCRAVSTCSMVDSQPHSCHTFPSRKVFRVAIQQTGTNIPIHIIPHHSTSFHHPQVLDNGQSANICNRYKLSTWVSRPGQIHQWPDHASVPTVGLLWTSLSVAGNVDHGKNRKRNVPSHSIHQTSESCLTS